MKNLVVFILISGILLVLTSCAHAKTTRAASAKKHIAELKIGEPVSSVVDRVGSPHSRRACVIDGQPVEILFYKTYIVASDLIEYKSRFTPLIFRSGNLAVIGEEMDKPEMSDGQIAGLLRTE